MNAREAALQMIENSGRTVYQAEKDLGKSRNYLKRFVYGDGNPRVDTLLQIAEMCGYTLVLRGDDGGELVISG